MKLIQCFGKSSEIHIGEVNLSLKEVIVKNYSTLKIDSKLHFWWSCKKANGKLQALVPATL